MAISQLFISRTNLQHLYKKGLTRRVCCSYSTETPKESMQTHSEAFPKAEQVPSEVGGSLKSILLKLKKNLFNGPWNENGTTNATNSEVMKKEVTRKIQPSEIITTDALHEMASSPSTVQMTESTHKPLTSEAPNIPVDQTSCEVRETHERVEAAKSDDLKQRSEPSNSTLPLEPGNEYQQHKVVRSTREISNMLDSTVKSVVASSTEKASNGTCKASHFSTSGSSKKTSGLADLLEDDKLTVKTSSEQTNGTSRDGLNTMQIKGLINQVKQIPKGTSEPRYEETSDILSECPPNDGGQAVSKVETSFSKLFTPDNLQKLDQPKSKKKKAKGKTAISQMILKEKENGGYTKLIGAGDDTANKVVSKNKCQKGNNSADTATDKKQSKPSPRILPLPPKNQPLKKDPNPLLFTEKGRDKTDVLVRFVPKSQNVEDIKNVFSNCGPIEDIQFISSSDFSIFKDAHIRFTTKDGMRNALAKTDVSLTVSKCKYNLIVEATSSSTYTTIKLQAPDLIGMPDVPPSLVINPTRTVMLKGLTDNISSGHLIDAFSFCGSHITGFFMGSSSSVAYIEFETEEAKEKAIAKFSICISGTKLSILRVDSPITTIVRISNIPTGQDVGKLLKICNSYGKAQQVVSRGRGIFDVHYKLTEWPVMVNILNSLNGKVIGENQVVAQPATEIPVEILKYLWSHADGRRWVYSAIQCLCRKLEDCSMEDVKVLAARYYEESIESVHK